MAATPPLDRLERVTDLVLVLLNTAQPLTLEAIAYQVPGYPLEHDAKRQAFERDKRLLRDEGIPLLTRALPGQDQYGYLIDREAFYLPDLALEPDEQVALHLAVAGVHLGDPSGRDALLKLGATGLGEVRPIASLVAPDALIDLFEAVRLGCETSFAYREGSRRVAPAGLWFRFGHWYLVAFDLDRVGVRTFRVDRIGGSVSLGPPGSAARVAGGGGGAVGGADADAADAPVGSASIGSIDVRAALPDDPWVSSDAAAEDQILTRIRVDAMEGPRVCEEVGEERVESREEDGSVTLRFTVSGFAPIRAWVLGLLQHAEILEPPEFRSEMRAWLEAMVEDAGDGDWDEAPGTPEEAAPAPTSPPAPTPARTLPPGREISKRLRRLLAVVGWLAQVGEAPIDEVARRFGMDEAELVYELELAACCGVPPYTPDALMEIVVSENTVRAFLPAEFARPRRLTPAEGFAVAASARLILAVPGSGSGNDALERAVAKLEHALGTHEAMGVDVDAPPFLAEVRAACEGTQVLRIEYHSASRDQSTSRVVEPVGVKTMDGHWYLDAYCRKAGDMRRFRVDRIRSLRVMKRAKRTAIESLGLREVVDGFLPGPGAVEVQLRLGKGSQWVAESVPVRSVIRGPDALVTGVVLDVAGLAWFERLLLQLGSEARVIRPAALRDLGKQAAQKVLRLYCDDMA
jgi:predicted DNA-binding transcriptional regulator YafY